MADDNCNNSGSVKKVKQYKMMGKMEILKANMNSKSKLKDLPTYFVGKKSKNCVIVCYDIFGFNERNKNVFEFCDMISSKSNDNYFVMMPDYFRENGWKLDEMGPKRDKDKFQKWWLSTADYNYVVDDMNERILPYLTNIGVTNICVIGLCWGGLIGFLLGGDNTLYKHFNGIIGIHAARIDDDKCNALKIPVFYGPADKDYPVENVKKILDTKPFGKDCIYQSYKDRIHGFCAARGDYNDPINRAKVDDVIGKSTVFINRIFGLDSNEVETKENGSSTLNIVVIGGNGTIGKCVVKAFKEFSETYDKDINIIIAGRNSGDIRIDLTDSKSIHEFYKNCKNIHHIIVTAGDSAFGDIKNMNRNNIVKAYQSKVFGSFEIVGLANKYLNKNGSITLTSGYTFNYGMIPGSSMAGAQNGALHAFTKATPIDMINNIRVNCVCPGLLTESKKKYGSYFVGLKSIDGSDVALAYLRSVFGGLRGKVLYTDAGTNCKEI